MNKAEIIKEIKDNGLVVKSTHKRFIQKKQPGLRA
jgi:hypothetical protein